MLIYFIFNIVAYATSNILLVKGIHNMPIYHIGSLGDLLLISYYILSKTGKQNWQRTFFIINIAYTLFFIINIIFWENLSVFNSNSSVVASLITLCLCMYYLLNLSKSDEILYFQRLPLFWIASGLLIYSAVSMLVLMSYKYFVSMSMFKEGNHLWYVLDGAIIVKFALISIGLLCHRKRPVIHSPFLF